MAWKKRNLYVWILDDGWQRHKGNRSNNPWEHDPIKFPNAMKALANYAHDNGFKRGTSSWPSDMTCAGIRISKKPRSWGGGCRDVCLVRHWPFEIWQILKSCIPGTFPTFAVACSHCDAPKSVVQEVVLKMPKSIFASGRPIVYHASHCGWDDICEWAAAG